MSHLRFVFWLLFGEIILLRAELWEKDLSSAMEIGLSTSGYSAVDLECGPDRFLVNVTLDEDFRGIVYTRGSFESRKVPCFKSHHQKTLIKNNKSLIGLRIPFHECRTVMDVAESRYTNTLVVQHDPDLIMPGDAAFSLDCAFVPEFKTGDHLDGKEVHFKSRITVVDADPSNKRTEAEEPSLTALSKTDKVTFVPSSGPPREEL